MSPLGIEIMFWHFTHSDKYRDGNYSAPAVRELLDLFVNEEMLIDNGNGQYTVTDRGRSYLKFLEAVPLPICKWVLP